MSKKKLFPANPETQTIEVTPLKSSEHVVIHVTPYHWAAAPQIVLHTISTGHVDVAGPYQHTLSQSTAVSLTPAQAVQLVDALQKALGALPETP